MRLVSAPRTLVLSSPHETGQDVKDDQWLLTGKNRFQGTTNPVHPYKGPIDGDFGEATAHAANRARYVLGYPMSRVNIDKFGAQLRSYLLPLTSKDAVRLPAAYKLRRLARLKLEAARRKKAATPDTPKRRALALALTQVGYRETPVNHTKYGVWFGFDGVPWCAIFVSYCLSHSGKSIKTALAYQWEYWGRANANGLSITYNPEPGDIVVYHEGQGHTGFFYRWMDRGAGHFQAIEGNELNQVYHKDRNVHSCPTVFVKVGS